MNRMNRNHIIAVAGVLLVGLGVAVGYGYRNHVRQTEALVRMGKAEESNAGGQWSMYLGLNDFGAVRVVVMVRNAAVVPRWSVEEMHTTPGTFQVPGKGAGRVCLGTKVLLPPKFKAIRWEKRSWSCASSLSSKNSIMKGEERLSQCMRKRVVDVIVSKPICDSRRNPWGKCWSNWLNETDPN